MPTIRPRRGDLEAATHPHEPIPSGEYVGVGLNRVERCDLCGCALTNRSAHPPRGNARRVTSMLAEADEAASEGRKLIERSIQLRKKALDSLPPGTTIVFCLKGVDFPPFRLSADGHWWTPEGDHGSPGWIEDQWMRGNLRLAKDHSPETDAFSEGR